MDTQKLMVIVEGNKIQVPSKFANVSNYMHGLLSLGFEEDQQIQIQRVSQQTLKQVIQFYELNNYEQVTIKTPIVGSDLESFVDKKNADYIQKHALNSPQFSNLYKAAEFLGCRNLLQLCASRFACLLYFQDSKQSFMQKQKQLGIQVKVQFEDNEKFKKLYPFMNKVGKN